MMASKNDGFLMIFAIMRFYFNLRELNLHKRPWEGNLYLTLVYIISITTGGMEYVYIQAGAIVVMIEW